MVVEGYRRRREMSRWLYLFIYGMRMLFFIINVRSVSRDDMGGKIRFATEQEVILEFTP